MKKLKQISCLLLLVIATFMISGCDLDDREVDKFINKNFTYNIEKIEGINQYENLIITNDSDNYINGLNMYVEDKKVDYKQNFEIFLKPHREVKLPIASNKALNKLKIYSKFNVSSRVITQDPAPGCVYSDEVSINLQEGSGVIDPNTNNYTSDHNNYQRAELVNNTDHELIINYRAIYAALEAEDGSGNIVQPVIVSGEQPVPCNKSIIDITLQPGQKQVCLQTNEKFEILTPYFIGCEINNTKQNEENEWQTFINQNLTFNVTPIEGVENYEIITISNNSDKYVNGLSIKLIDNQTSSEVYLPDLSSTRLYMRPHTEVKFLAKSNVTVDNLTIKNYTSGPESISDSADENIVYASDLNIELVGSPTLFDKASEMYQELKVTNTTNNNISIQSKNFMAYANVLNQESYNFKKLNGTLSFTQEQNDVYTPSSSEFSFAPGTNTCYFQASISNSKFKNFNCFFYGFEIDNTK